LLGPRNWSQAWTLC